MNTVIFSFLTYRMTLGEWLVLGSYHFITTGLVLLVYSVLYNRLVKKNVEEAMKQAVMAKSLSEAFGSFLDKTSNL